MGLFSRDPDRDDDADGESTGFWQERGFVASAIVIGAVLICLVVWIFARGSGTPNAQPTESPGTSVVPTEQPTTEEPSVPPATPTEEPTSTPTSPPPANGGKGGCKNKHPDETMPLAAPAGVSWQFEADLLIPLQEAAGPAVTDASGVRSCFAHSPTGSVFAAMVLLGQIRNPSLTKDVLRTRIMPGPGRNRALAEIQATPTPKDLGQVQFAGFKIIDYLPNRAIIQVAAQVNNKSVASLPVTMVWSGSDWKGVLRQDGSFNGDVAPEVLQTMDGYVGFRGA